MPRRTDEAVAIRAFIAVELGDAARRAAGALAASLRAAPGGGAVRWVRPELLHVTLRFLGDIAPEQVPDLAREVPTRVAPLAPFRLALGTLHGFPSPRRPRVLALEVLPAEPLAELAAAVERGVVAAGLPPETRPFRPHLTLGRIRPGRSAPRGTPVTAAVTALGEAFDVTEAVLFQSELFRGGARHSPLGRYPLAGDPDRSGRPGRFDEGDITPDESTRKGSVREHPTPGDERKT